MSTDKPTMEQWRRAYKLAGEIRDLAPWAWMYDNTHLGFVDPKNATQHFISIMGNAGEHFAVAVYRSAEDLFKILDMIENPDSDPYMLFETSQLQLSFEDRSHLDSADLRIIKTLKLGFRGKQAWPCFRSFLPGQVPWQLNSDELRLLCIALEQVLIVAPRFKDDEDKVNSLTNLGMDGHVFLMRAPLSQDPHGEWQESMVEVARPPVPEISPVELDEKRLERAMRLPRAKGGFEADTRLLPSPIQERQGERSYFPVVLMLVEQERGLVFGCEMMAPRPTLTDAYRRVPEKLLAMLVKEGRRPEEIHVRTEQMASLLRGLCEKLDIRLTVRPSLPQLEEAFTSLRDFSARN
ncbi:MAG: hypothetical protein GX945_08375 [Lentisphaerae bacterium]|nr:hypothetical protein [Lentisphaerota bacterium]